MDASILTGAMGVSGIAPTDYMSRVAENTLLAENRGETFESVLASAMNLLTETNALQNDAQSEKIKFALGKAENPHDMQVAAAKALEALQYTTAVRDRMLDAYKEIMNMQI